MTISLSSKLSAAVGDRTAKAFENAFGYTTVGELLHHFPRRHMDRGRLTKISDLSIDDHVTVMARVESIKHQQFRGNRRKWLSKVKVTDGTDTLELAFFNQKWRIEKLKAGSLGMFSGKVSEFQGQLQLTHPDFEMYEEHMALVDSRMSRGIIPIYRATSKVSSWRIAAAIEVLLDVIEDTDDPIDADTAQAHDVWDRKSAYEGLHRPRNRDDIARAIDRMKFEEAFVIQAILTQRRIAVEHESATPRASRAGGVREAFAERLPFTLTAGQVSVSEAISHDLAGLHPMHRLLQGEVGSGKTIVALLAMLQVVDAGAQAALLAPTEVLASQHFRSFTEHVGDLVRVRLLTGSQSTAERKEALLDAQSGRADIVVGTHALIQEHVGFADLGLVVVDEQHRFGVEQRAALAVKAETKPHILVMTATPIPRTVAMMAFGDLDISVLDELPHGRQPIATTVVPIADKPAWFERVWERIREEAAKGRQAYVVCPRIGLEDESDAETFGVISTYEHLTSGPLSSLRIGQLHGRMSPKDKDEAMRAFADGDIDVLVATTVVEVGVDVPNATVMVILDADRFGIAQLHQLRGRVGRGEHEGLCLLVTRADAVSTSGERLRAVASTTDGFELSRLDVEFRREGDVLGTSQSGYRSSLQFLSVLDDDAIIDEALQAVEPLVRADPDLSGYPKLLDAIRQIEDTAEYLEKT